MVRRRYSSTAVDTVLSAVIGAADITLTVNSDTGYPAVPFIIVLDPDTGSEELVLVEARTGTLFSSLTRGYDGTAAVAHSAGAIIKHVATGLDFDEVWTHVHDTADGHTQVSHTKLGDLTTGDPHTQYLKEKGSGLAAEIPEHTHASAAEAGQVDHGALAGLADNDHTQYSLTAHPHVEADVTDLGDYYEVGGTDVPVADGGTGASTAAAARTNLGVASESEGIRVFADATARNAAITAPVEGMHAYLSDTNTVTYHTGAAWVSLLTGYNIGDLANVNQTGIAAGSILYYNGTNLVNLGIGTAGQALTVNAGATAPAWADGGGGSSGSFRIMGLDAEVSHTNFKTSITLDATYWLAHYRGSSGDQNAEVVFAVPPLQGGTWTLTMLYRTGSDQGIYTIAESADAAAWTDLTTVDGYSSSTVKAVRTEKTGLTVTEGTKYIRLKMATKNASSGFYRAYFSALSGTRTGA